MITQGFIIELYDRINKELKDIEKYLQVRVSLSFLLVFRVAETLTNHSMLELEK